MASKYHMYVGMVDSYGITGLKGSVDAQAEFRLVLAKANKRVGSDQPESITFIIMQSDKATLNLA